MAFFASPQRELYEHRLKRSSSTTSVRTRPCRPFGSQAFPSRSRINSSDSLPSASIPDTPSAQYNPSQTPVPPPVPPSGTPSPSSMSALHTPEQSMRAVLFALLFFANVPTLKIQDSHPSRCKHLLLRVLPSLATALRTCSPICVALILECKGLIPVHPRLLRLFRAQILTPALSPTLEFFRAHPLHIAISTSLPHMRGPSTCDSPLPALPISQFPGTSRTAVTRNAH